jgi:3-oxoacyl-[acyl-carrier protein] reductase
MLKNKTAIVTGAARGIGKSIALKLASLGANIVVNYTSKPEAAEEVVSEIKKLGVKAIAVKADVRNTKEVEEMINKAHEEFESIDILVNNAGITKDNLMLRMTEQDFNDVIDINLIGTFNCIKSVAKIMLKQRSGRIINIASVIGLVGNAGQANYAASKAGIIGLTKSVAKEFGSRGITVNAIAPGFIKTDMTNILSEKVKENILNQIPLGTLGEAEDIANLAAFLASENARYITGQVINVDGGMVM